MTTDVYNLLLTDCALAAILLGLFWYVSRVSRGVRGIASWGLGHFFYSVGAAMLDGAATGLERAGSTTATAVVAATGGVLACGGLAVMAGAVIKFGQQRPLTRAEWMVVPGFVAMSLAAWLAGDAVDGQGAAMSVAELAMLAVVLWQLRGLDVPPLRVPARLVMLGCAVLAYLYGRDLLQALTGRYGPNDAWVNVDLSTWYLINFCMLMLASFRAAESLRQTAMLDPLTGTLNRRGLFARLDPELEQLTREAHLAVIALDSATASRRRVTRCFVISWVSSFFYLATPHNLAFAGYFSPIHRFEKFEVLRSRWRLCRLTDAACPLRVHKVHLHFSNLVSTKNLSANALAE